MAHEMNAYEGWCVTPDRSNHFDKKELDLPHSWGVKSFHIIDIKSPYLYSSLGQEQSIDYGFTF